MKKRNLFYALTAGIALFSACNNNSDEFTPSDDNAAQQLVLQVASSGDGLTTRAGRPLYSSEAGQMIDKIKVIIKKNKDKMIAYAGEISEWNTISKEYTQNGHGRQYTLTLKGDNKLKQGEYTVVAVGYSNETYTFAPTLESLTVSKTLADNISATVKNDAEEIFAGEAALSVDQDGKFTLTTNTTGVVVTLHRQVAGGIGYFHNIPAAVDGVEATTLRLVARSKNQKVTFENFNSAFTTTQQGAKYIVNGSNPAAKDAKFSDSQTNDGNELYSINLQDWFQQGDQNKNGFYDKADAGYQKPAGVKTNLVKGSVFAGKFIIPFALESGKNTMELQLLDVAGNILRTWGVKIKQTDLATGKNTPEVDDESVSIFNVVRNHMYNLGVKTTHNPEGPDPEEKPNVEEPEDLSKNQDLILQVNDNWELIHRMELD